MGVESGVRKQGRRDKLIVMPVQGSGPQDGPGMGLGIHFFLGNLVCLHPALAECWFGWRVKKIFPESRNLAGYCRGTQAHGDIHGLGEREKVRYWIEGQYSPGRARLDLVLHDTLENTASRESFEFEFKDGFQGFRRTFFQWLDARGIEGNVSAPAFWPETITPGGMGALGSALGSLYGSYVTDLPLSLDAFEAAVGMSSDSYLAQDLLGWGLYKVGHHARAEAAFLRAVEINPHGMGALAGLMWCAVAAGDRDRALGFALKKGDCRGESPDRARAFVAKKFP